MQKSDNFNFEIIVGLRRLNDLIESKILWEDLSIIYRQSVYIEILIVMRDLLKKMEKLNSRITFAEDVKIRANDKICDVTDLIIKFRNAACHINSPKKFYEDKVFAFIELRGKKANEYDTRIFSEYDDDIAFVMGQDVLYLKRHIERVFSDIKAFMKDYLGEITYNFALRLSQGS